MIGLEKISPHKTVQIDVKKLRDEQTPDERGNTIPVNVNDGQIKWTIRSEEYINDTDVRKSALIGRSEQIDTINGISSSYACQNCCQKTAWGWISSGGITEAEVGDQIQFTAYEEGYDCYGWHYGPYQYDNDEVDWDSSNDNIATVSNLGLVTIVGVGEVEIDGDWTRYVTGNYGGYCPDPPLLVEQTKVKSKLEEKQNSEEMLVPDCSVCQTVPREIGSEVDISVAPTVQKIQYQVDGNWFDIPGGGLGPICKGTVVTFKAVPTSGAWSSNRPTWGGDASGTGAEKTVTFSSSGARMVSASSGNTISATINVGAENANINITWLSPNTTTNTGTGAATTTAAPFVPEYTACADLGTNEWKLRAMKVEGQTNITIPTGGYRNPSTSPPVSQLEAIDAVDEMNDYYPSGSRQSWHTPSASEAHENYHNTEWTCTGNHYWGPTETALEMLKVSYTMYNTEAAAITQMKTGASGADAKMTAFRQISDTYWASLADNGGSRPYAAGQLVLNGEIRSVIALAMANGWTGVPGVANASPNTANPCYQPFGTYNP